MRALSRVGGALSWGGDQKEREYIRQVCGEGSGDWGQRWWWQLMGLSLGLLFLTLILFCGDLIF